MPDVSIIIPCFNHGQFIHETIDSVLDQTHKDFEIIVVNDGSTEHLTNDILKRINHPRIKVIHTSNQGLAAARNNGIREAQAEIILPLDSDDKIRPTYIEKALKIFRDDPSVGIVYCYAELFGEKRGRWILPEYSLTAMLFHNLLFCSSFFLRQDWERSKGFNPNMEYGWEDWDLWLSIISTGKNVHRIPETLFLYRVSRKSMVHSMTDQQKAAMHVQVFFNHLDFYRAHAQEYFEQINLFEKNCNRSIIDRLINDKMFHPFQTLKNIMHRFDANP